MPDPKRIQVGGVKYRLLKGKVPEWKKWTKLPWKPFWWVANRIIAIKYIKYPKRH